MTDEQLIEEARERLAVSRLGKSMWRETDRDLVVIRQLVEALEAHTPTDDERRSAARELRDIGRDIETDDEREGLAKAWADNEFPETPLTTGNEQLADAAYEAFCAGYDAGFHRSEVPEPSGQVLAWIDRTLALPMYQTRALTDYDDAVVTTLKTVRKMLDGTTRPDASWRTTQGEPSDAQVAEIEVRALEGFLGKLAGGGAYTLNFGSANELYDDIVRVLRRDIEALRADGGGR